MDAVRNIDISEYTVRYCQYLHACKLKQLEIWVRYFHIPCHCSLDGIAIAGIASNFNGHESSGHAEEKIPFYLPSFWALGKNSYVLGIGILCRKIDRLCGKNQTGAVLRGWNYIHVRVLESAPPFFCSSSPFATKRKRHSFRGRIQSQLVYLGTFTHTTSPGEPAWSLSQ